MDQDAQLDPDELLSAIHIDRTRRFNIDIRGDLSVRPFPFPFGGGMAIVNDCRGQDRRTYEAWHSIVCGTGETEFGTGLGLEIGDSCLVQMDGGEPRLSFGEVPDAADDAARLATLIRDGWVDALICEDPAHLVALDQSGIDAPAVLAADYDTAHHRPPDRFRFVTDNHLLERQQFGVCLDFRYTEALRNGVGGYRWSQWAPPAGLADCDREAQEDFWLDRWNAALFKDRADEDVARSFKQFVGRFPSSMSSFSSQVRTVDLDGMINRYGLVFLQTRMAMASLVGRSDARAMLSRHDGPVLDPDAFYAWREIGQRFDQGELLVATARRLLDWCVARQTIDLTLEKSADRWNVTVDADRGTGEVPAGFAIVVPSDAPEVEVRMTDGVPLSMTRDDDPRYVDRDCLWTEWPRRIWPAEGEQAS